MHLLSWDILGPSRLPRTLETRSFKASKTIDFIQSAITVIFLENNFTVQSRKQA